MEVVFLPNSFHEIEQTASFRLRTVFNANQSAGSATLNTDHSLLELNEITVGNEQVFSSPLIPGTMNLILPLVGELSIEKQHYNNQVEPGQLLTVYGENDSLLNLRNNSTNENCLFLQIIYKSNANPLPSQIQDIDIDHPNQQLHDFQILPEVTLSIGKFLGRFDHSFDINKTKQIVAYVISGVFELEHRLLETGDVIMLSGLDKNQMEFESLSVESILLIFKFKK